MMPTLNKPTAVASNADPAELEKFGALATRWWDLESEFKPLHAINPLRLGWLQALAGDLSSQRILDVGCGGGILAESMARESAEVTGIDLSARALQVARLHSLDSGVALDYQLISAEDFAAQHPASFDIVTCMEMLEHVPDPASVVRACAALLRPGGWLFLSTLNRNLKSFALAIVGAEYLLRLLPRGTHSYEHFIRPSELATQVRAAGLLPERITGLTYNPLTRHYALSADTDVNYLMAARK